MVRRRAFVLAILAACSHPAPPVTPKVVAPDVKPAPKAEPIWPMPMRVMTWTEDRGLVQVGVLPDQPPSVMPSTPWFVEPMPGKPVDRAMFDRIVVALRSQHVPGLSMRGRAVAGLLPAMKQVPEVTALVLDDSDVDGAALDAIGSEMSLRRVYLAGTAIDDGAIAKLVARHDKLEVVDLRDTAITDKAVTSLATLPELRAIDLSGTAISDAGTVAIAGAAKLDVVDLGRTRAGAATLAAIAKLPLRQLFLDGTTASTDAIAKLAPLAPTLERIDISNLEGGGTRKLVDAHLAWLATAPHLIEAGLGGAQIHDPLVKKLLAIATLRELRISEAPITAALAHEIARLRPELEEIDLGDTVADDAAVGPLLALPNLRVIRLDHTKITDAALRGSISKNLVELYASKTALTDTGLAALDAIPDLEALALGDTKIDMPTIARIAKLAKLHTLVLTRVRPKSAGGESAFAALGALHGLVRLYLDDAWLGDTAFAAFADLDELRVLHVANTSLSPESLPILRGFTLLEELAIGDTRMTRAIADLSAWPRLRTLALLGLDLHDDALVELAKRPSLALLDLSNTEITDPAPLAALPRLRTLGLVETKLSPAGKTSAAALRKRGVDVIDH